MIEGYVNEALEPVVEIGLKCEDAITVIPAVVDTGFSGYLCLGSSLFRVANRPSDAARRHAWLRSSYLN